MQVADTLANTIEDYIMAKRTKKLSNFTDNQTIFIDNINFEDTAKQMAELKSIIFDSPDTNQTKIQFIKEELSANRYEIHSNHIASKLLEYAELPLPELAEMAE